MSDENKKAAMILAFAFLAISSIMVAAHLDSKLKLELERIKLEEIRLEKGLK